MRATEKRPNFTVQFKVFERTDIVPAPLVGDAWTLEEALAMATGDREIVPLTSHAAMLLEKEAR